jgi:hypothetical protein
MSAEIRIVNMYTNTDLHGVDGAVVNTTSKADTWERDLSPFHLGPCRLYGGYQAIRMENAWQFSKLYAVHAKDGEPTPAYWSWATQGWEDPVPRRYPMGRGAKPLCSFWDRQKYGYIDARKRIYAPLYTAAVQRTKGWKKLQELYDTKALLVLRDYDGYDSLGQTLSQVLNNPARKMGHAFVLAMLLTQDSALEEIHHEV